MSSPEKPLLFQSLWSIGSLSGSQNQALSTNSQKMSIPHCYWMIIMYLRAENYNDQMYLWNNLPKYIFDSLWLLLRVFLKKKCMEGGKGGRRKKKWDFQESFAHILFGNFLCLINWKKKRKKKKKEHFLELSKCLLSHFYFLLIIKISQRSVVCCIFISTLSAQEKLVTDSW